MMNKKSILVSIVVILVLIAGFVIFQNSKKEKAPAKSQVAAVVPVEKVAIKNEVVTTSKYSNTKYNYTLNYPSSYFIYQNVAGGEGPVAQNVTEKGDDVFISKDENSIDSIFDIRSSGISTLNASSVKDQFGATKPSEINVLPLVVGGQNGYKVVFNKEDSSRVSDFYFVKNTNGQILEVTVLKSNEVAQQVFSSLSFVK